MIKLALSLTVFNQEYENKLLKYVIPSLIKNIKNNNLKILFFINASNNNILNKITEIFIKEKLDFKIFSKIIKDKEINNFNYKNLTKNQVSHFSKSKKLKCDYIVFLYADMFYGPKSIENSLKILSKNRSIKGCCSFGIELHQNKYLDKFYYLLFKKSKVTTANDYLINNLKNIISPFHKNYIVDYGLPTNFNFFIFHKINNYFFLKTFDYHPLIMRIKNEVRFNENEPIDYKFIRKNDFNKWHIEKDLLKISCFSITDNFLQRNYFRKYKNLNLTKKKLSYLFYKCIYYNINKFCNNKKDFYNNYFYLKNSTKKINHSNVNKIINLNIKKDNIQNMFNNFFLILKLLCDIRLLKTLLMLIITGKKKYLVSSNIFNNDKLILLKSLTSLVFNTIFNR